eukprot:11838550-Alexandrium_andersonii.AAC.1
MTAKGPATDKPQAMASARTAPNPRRCDGSKALECPCAQRRRPPREGDGGPCSAVRRTKRASSAMLVDVAPLWRGEALAIILAGQEGAPRQAGHKQ